MGALGGDYLGATSFKVTWAPARAAYLIANGSEAGLRSAIREACTRWGGLTEPILEVTPGEFLDAWSQQTLEAAALDGLVLVDADPEQSRLIASGADLPLVDLQHIDRSGITRFSINPASVTSWAREPNPPVIAREGGRLWEVVAAGDLTDDACADLRETGHSVRRPQSEDSVGRAQLTGAGLVQRTITGLDETWARGSLGASPTLVWLCKDDDFADCHRFWNIRALAPVGHRSFPTVLLPSEPLADWLNLDSLLHSLLRRPAEFSPDVSLVSMSLTTAEVLELGEQLGLKASTEKPFRGQRWPVEMRTAPFTFRADLDERDAVVFQRSYGRSTDVDTVASSESTTVRVRCPVDFSASGYTLVRFSSEVFDGLPRREGIAEMIMLNAAWSGQELRVATNAQSDYKWDLRIPSLRDAVITLLGSTTAGHELSDKGRLATPLSDSPEGVQHLLEDGVLSSMRALTTPRSKDLVRELKRVQAEGVPAAALERLAASWGQKVERRFLTAEGVASAGGSLTAVERLVNLGWAHRGLALECDHCGVRSFVPMDHVSDRSDCPGCRSRQSYAASPGGQRVDIYYRLSTFLDRCSDQGLLPPIVVLAALRAESTHSFILPGVNVSFEDGQKAEADLYGVHDGLVVCGEVKTAAAAFTEEQVARDIEISERLEADVHLMAALDEVPGEMRSQAESVCRQKGLQLRVICGLEVIAGAE